MKVQTKLTALMGVIVVVFFVGFLFLLHFERHRAAALFRSEQQLEEQFFDRLISLKGSSLETLVNDYTYWDEMVRFVATGDKQWAADIIDTDRVTWSIMETGKRNISLAMAYRAARAIATPLHEIMASACEIMESKNRTK